VDDGFIMQRLHMWWISEHMGCGGGGGSMKGIVSGIWRWSFQSHEMNHSPPLKCR
jgi:hypothetical protein